MPPITTAQIAQHVQGHLDGPSDLILTGAETLELATAEQLTFIGDAKYARLWPQSKAVAALIDRSIDLQPGPGRALIRVPQVDLAMALVLDLMAPQVIKPAEGIHASAWVDPSAQVGKHVSIGAQVYVGAQARIGDGAVLHPGVCVLDHATIGPNTILHSGVVIRERCQLGARCILHANVVIGADGFGYRPSTDPVRPGLVKITHIGNVVIGDDVEIGAGTCIDRGKFSATTIGSGTKIDNLCQIGHNCRIGRSCILCGQVGLAGSVIVGDGATLGGKVGVRDHLTIGAGAKVAAMSALMTDVPPGETWAGYPAQEIKISSREILALRQLPDLLRKLRKMDRQQAKNQ